MERLGRLETVFTDAPVYFITACTEKRRCLLASREAHEVFQKFCVNARDRGVLVGRYVLMPDHLLLFVCIPPGAVGLSMWMKSLKTRFPNTGGSMESKLRIGRRDFSII